MNGIIDFNWLGVAFVSENVPNYKEIEEKIENKMEELREKAMEEFDEYLDSLGLEQVMGVIKQKEITNIYLEAFKTLPLKDIDHNSFSSDLYLRVTPKSRKLIDRYKYSNNVSTFRDNIEHKLWYEIPLAFPYKIFEEIDGKTVTWYFLKYDENGNHVYNNGLCNVGAFKEHYVEMDLTIDDLKKYRW